MVTSGGYFEFWMVISVVLFGGFLRVVCGLFGWFVVCSGGYLGFWMVTSVGLFGWFLRVVCSGGLWVVRVVCGLHLNSLTARWLTTSASRKIVVSGSISS
uniref:Transmembrane protein n=1 Tax=Cacopsylla melanoneura TaxID=428564 RepID=A0A8D8M2F2_9HEMI